MWELRTGCRLHFGLMELSPQAPNRYAGLGVMLQLPTMLIRIDNSIQPNCVACDDSIDSASLTEYQTRIDAWLQQHGLAANIELLSGYPFHSGLGAGTQLACLLAVAGQLLNKRVMADAGSQQWQPIRSWLGALDPDQLAALSGRGLRSAIGLQGFLSGGLILDSGYQSSENRHRSVKARVSRLPAHWSFVLIRGSSNSSITGPLESEMIRNMAAQPNANRQHMMRLAQQSLDFAEEGNFEQYSVTLEEYMQFAGDMFAKVQGGRYNGAVCSQAVAMARRLGLRAVGQSSWGPTIFGICPDPILTRQIVSEIRQLGSTWQVQIAQPAQHGAEVRYFTD